MTIRDHELAPFVRARTEPTIGAEGPRIRKHRFVGMDAQCRHTDRGPGWNGVVVVAKSLAGCDARIPSCEAEGKTVGFEDDAIEEGQLLESGEG